ncbi:hypothetical protein KZY42_004422 [Vibrio vulnificus]|uniref:hypothetical protein n=1 Tax=Vibrio cholerae TaxID=666 RepID=UPI0011DA4016|nr:hypothetical protein [Vibrio cholerae]EHU9446916.1 hypothetical protein [Vibrio vulnificus]MDG3438719.1 hypothetical protein [Vibrio parahaemolyticus]EGR0366659.1 hypothetical protein [Vibrio cholerae]EGR0939426.1 hypothetical protein [Vibrio cholerae]EIA0769823.1 hypothetical protein [Vibrio cholerae]
MSNDIQLIVTAIEGLHTNFVKDYILPVGSVLISGALGAGVAYYTVNQQEFTKIELDKIRTVNKTLLSALELRSSLIGIKSNYFGLITDEPINRMLGVPPVLLKETKVEFDLPSLSFISQHEASEFNKWASLDYIATIVSNFNTVIKVWEKRNSMIEALMPKLSEVYGKPLKFPEIQSLIGVGNMALLSDLTERCLHMTDDLLVEVSCFLVGFSAVVDGKIDIKILKKFGGRISPSLPTYEEYPLAVDILTKVPTVNYVLLGQIQGRKKQDLEERYRPIYK